MELKTGITIAGICGLLAMSAIIMSTLYLGSCPYIETIIHCLEVVVLILLAVMIYLFIQMLKRSKSGG
jgi:chromate transport protein ChrA